MCIATNNTTLCHALCNDVSCNYTFHTPQQKCVIQKTRTADAVHNKPRFGCRGNHGCCASNLLIHVFEHFDRGRHCSTDERCQTSSRVTLSPVGLPNGFKSGLLELICPAQRRRHFTAAGTRQCFVQSGWRTIICMYVCMYVFSKHTLTFNTLRHGPRQYKQRMCSEGQTGVKHLQLPKKHIKQTRNSDCVIRILVQIHL